MSWASLLVLVVGACARPHRAACPPGRDLRVGVRRTGVFECWSAPAGDPDWDGTFGRPERGVQAGDSILGKIYCGPGEVPVILFRRSGSELDSVECRNTGAPWR